MRYIIMSLLLLSSCASVDTCNVLIDGKCTIGPPLKTHFERMFHFPACTPDDVT